MALPPKGDPRRPLHLAVRSMRLLGGILLLFSSCGIVGVIRMMMLSSAVVPFMMLGLLVYLIPGVGFFVCAYYLKRRRFWAVVVSICLAALGALYVLLGLGVFAFALSQQQWYSTMLIPFGALALLLAAMIQLIYYLARSFEAIKHMPAEERGFEPIMAMPVQPNFPPPLPPMETRDEPPHA